MTIEEKAKAYDEALKRAKFFHGNCPSEPERRKLEKMFPVLRESKDERIRISLIKFLTDIKEISESGRTIWAVRKEDAEMCKSFLVWLKKQKECVADNSKTSTDEDERIINQLITLVNSAGEVLLIPTNKEELVAWLEKQKESLPISEICKENANSFADGIIEVRSFQRGMEEGRRLEKQKEQMMDEWLKDRDGCFWDGVEEGKKAMKDQMMKGAVEAHVVQSFNPCTEEGESTIHAVLLLYKDDGKPYLVAGEDARIIILPKED